MSGGILSFYNIPSRLSFCFFEEQVNILLRKRNEGIEDKTEQVQRSSTSALTGLSFEEELVVDSKIRWK